MTTRPTWTPVIYAQSTNFNASIPMNRTIDELIGQTTVEGTTLTEERMKFDFLKDFTKDYFTKKARQEWRIRPLILFVIWLARYYPEIRHYLFFAIYVPFQTSSRVDKMVDSTFQTKNYFDQECLNLYQKEYDQNIIPLPALMVPALLAKLETQTNETQGFGNFYKDYTQFTWGNGLFGNSSGADPIAVNMPNIPFADEVQVGVQKTTGIKLNKVKISKDNFAISEHIYPIFYDFKSNTAYNKNIPSFSGKIHSTVKHPDMIDCRYCVYNVALQRYELKTLFN